MLASLLALVLASSPAPVDPPAPAVDVTSTAVPAPPVVDDGLSCPAGARLIEQPPRGTGSFCAITGARGELLRHGPAVLVHPTSRRRSEACEYRDGVRDGACALFDESGDPQERGSFASGARRGGWWYWSIPTASDRRRTLTLPLGDPGAAVLRRQEVHTFFVELGAGAPEATALTDALLDYVDHDGVARRQVCGPRLCLGPGRIPAEAIYVADATPVQTRRDRKLLAQLGLRARKHVRDELRAEQSARAREAAELRRAEQAEARAQPEPFFEPDQTCCRVCNKGKPCGDSCIAANKTCRKGRGCAC